MNMARAVTISDKANDNLAEVIGSSLHTVTTEMDLQASTEATTKNAAATPRVNVSVSAFGLKRVLVAVNPARKIQAMTVAIPAILAKRAARACSIN
jgi:hypothetical protein